MEEKTGATKGNLCIWYFTLVGFFSVFVWVRLQNLRLLQYWWVFKNGSLERVANYHNIHTWLLIIVLSVIFFLALYFSKRSLLAVLVGLAIVFSFTMQVTKLLYSDTDWNMSLAYHGYNKAIYQYRDLFANNEGKTYNQNMFFKYNDFLAKKEVDSNGIKFGIAYESLATHPPGHLLVYGNIAAKMYDSVLNKENLPRGNEHVQGNTAYYYFGISLIITIISTYFFASYISGQRAVGISAAATAVLAPTFLVYSPWPDVLVAAMFIMTLAMLLLLENKDVLIKALSVIAVAISAFSAMLLTYGMMVMIPTIALFLFIRYRLGKINLKTLCYSFLAIVLVIVVLFVWLNNEYQYNYWYGYQLAIPNQMEVQKLRNISWLWSQDFNVYEVFPMLGLASIIAVLWSFFRRNNNPSWWLALFSLVIFAAIDLSGVSKGENSKIMVFLAPLFASAAAYFISSRTKNIKWAGFILPALIAYQTIYFSYYFVGFQFMEKLH